MDSALARRARLAPCRWAGLHPCNTLRVALGLPVFGLCFPCYVRARELRARLVLAVVLLAGILGMLHG